MGNIELTDAVAPNKKGTGKAPVPLGWEPERPDAENSLRLLPSGPDRVGESAVRPTPGAHMAVAGRGCKVVHEWSGTTRGQLLANCPHSVGFEEWGQVRVPVPGQRTTRAASRATSAIAASAWSPGTVGWSR